MRKMTNAALMETPLIRIKDIQQAFGVSYDAAARFIRTVKAHSERRHSNALTEEVTKNERFYQQNARRGAENYR